MILLLNQFFDQNTVVFNKTLNPENDELIFRKLLAFEIKKWGIMVEITIDKNNVVILMVKINIYIELTTSIQNNFKKIEWFRSFLYSIFNFASDFFDSISNEFFMNPS